MPFRHSSANAVTHDRRISGRRRWLAGLAALLAVGVVDAGTLQAQARSDGTASPSLLGNYLAGRQARGRNDTAAATEFYRRAIARDPKNDVIAEQAFLMEASEGNWKEASALARQITAGDNANANRTIRLWLGVEDFAAGRLEDADAHFKAAAQGPIGELTSALSRAWVKSAANETDRALTMLDVPRQAEWAQFYLRYHRALMADVGGRRAEARASFERIAKQDTRAPRTVLAYAQHAASAGDLKLARSIVKDHIDKSQTGDGHPMVRALRDQLATNVAVPMLIETARDGLAEVYYGLGEALAGEGGLPQGGIFLQMALKLRPDFPFALAALAHVHETSKNYERAIATYNRIPAGTPLQSSIEIRKAINLNLLERPDEAKTVLERLAAENPRDLQTLDTLGSIMRARKRYDEAVEIYSRAIALIAKPEKRHWSYWYARGTSYERLKKWPLAEADLQKALQLSPDQPLVLNYLGYSWIDQNRNLKQGMSLIEKAVSLKPDDGYIVDSLGWAHFKQSNFKDAARYLERAVELRPEDPVLNDHLGDALWRVGRTREARYQWEQALTLKPEPEDAEKIRAKLDKGLPERAPVAVPRKAKEARRPDLQRKRVENRSPVAPQQPAVQ
jgi:tetratricopeptide (TPR) repeat protein